MPRPIPSFFVLLLSTSTALAQPANDNCLNAFPLPDEASWCSPQGGFSNLGANAPPSSQADCLSGAFADVWFSFVPLASSVTVTVIGNNSVGGTGLLLPEIAIFTGSCDDLQLVGCKPAPSFGNVNSLSLSGLALGEPHFILVQGRSGVTGPFQLCANIYNLPMAPSSDCPEAAILCDKAPFVVQQLSGPGNDPTEANDAPCLNSFGVNVESNSTWFVWTAGNSGSLTFTLTPLNPPDDLDFVVYEFPNGPGNCAGQIPLRCMASSCPGATGLNETSTDISEPPNCNPAFQDNFLAALQMEEGKTYGVMVNNFSPTGMGFLFEFGGTGQFVGPEPGFRASLPQGCIEQAVSFVDTSVFSAGMIVGWEWAFGPGAEPAEATGPGPHEVTYRTPGLKPVLLSLTTAQGCIVSVRQEFEVLCCERLYQAQTAVSPIVCPGGADGAISVEMAQPPGPYAFSWSNGQAGPAVSGLSAGSYSVTVSEALGCDTILTFLLEAPPPFVFDTAIVMPTCNGGMDGSIGLGVSGGTMPYQFSLNGGPLVPQGQFSGLPVGDYAIRVVDANDCQEDLLIPIQELELALDPIVQAVIPPTCFGFSDAVIQVGIGNGLPPYQYDFNDGLGYRDASSLAGLPAGLYAVAVLDANLCQGGFSFAVEDPPPLAVEFSESPISCHGAADGVLTALPGGGAGDYRFEWSTGATDSALEGLTAGAYALTLTDAAGCILTVAYPLEEPEALLPEVAAVVPPLCVGDANGSITLSATGGIMPYVFSLGGSTPQAAPAFSGLAAGVYPIVVTDAAGCSERFDFRLEAPQVLIVDAGSRQTVILGSEASLRAAVNDPDVSYQWSPAESLSCSDCPAPLALPLRNTVYTVKVQDANGCTALDSVEVRISAERPLYIPNAFSPNDDGRNDLFTAYGGPGLRQIVSLKVFNRWGGLVFEQQNLGPAPAVVAWNGFIQDRPAPSGTYAYLFEAEFIDGQKQHFYGEVVLIR